VLIAGHAGVNRLLLCHVLGIPTQHMFRIDQNYGCMNVLRGHEEAFRVSLMNFVPDGAAGAEPVSAMA
jgi:probable phosphoglycerate mutase